MFSIAQTLKYSYDIYMENTCNDEKQYQDINARTIDRWIADGWEWGKPISHELYKKALAGDWQVCLTPTKSVPHEWFGSLQGKKLLGLASGGGQQMPIFHAAGADCAVLDYSEQQIASERAVAERESYSINAIRADMTKSLPFGNAEFDIVFNPVSLCYVKDVAPIFKECYRVLKKDGVFMAGLDIGTNFITDDAEEKIVNSLPFDPIANPKYMKQLQDNDCGVQFSHTVGELLGELLKAGFVLTDVYEDTNGEGRLHELNIPSFIAVRAVK